MSFFTLPNFPPSNNRAKHNHRDYKIAIFTFVTVTICLTMDGYAPQKIQYVLAFFGWLFLLAFLRGESKFVRTQVAVAISFAVIGEYFASIYMQGYIYRFENLPAYVPAGHGLVYLTAVALARSGLFQRYARHIAILVVSLGAVWAFCGISPLSSRPDLIGFLLFLVFLLYLFKGKSPMVYLGAFFITSWLELVGTSAGTWAWASIDPATSLPQGNPPSGVAAWYCLVDAVAIAGATPLLIAVEKSNLFLRKRIFLFEK
jgi:hypothetical protein